MAAYLTKTLGTPTNNLKWTFSGWIKIGGMSGDRGIFALGDNSTDFTRVNMNGNGAIEFDNKVGSTFDGRRMTSAYHRDPAAWYHIVAVFDSANATADDKMILYVNGSRITALGTDIDPSASAASGNTSSKNVRLSVMETSSYFTGNMAHVHFCDGYAYAASDFGETDSTSGIWVAKTSPSVSYGNNGFFLKFQDTSAFGDDSSGNNNDMTVSGTITQTQDTPDNNFCTWNPLNVDHGETYEFKNGNTIALIPSASGWSGTSGTLFAGAGKWYVEGYVTYTPGAYNTTFGFASDKAIAMKSAYGQIGYMDPGSLSTYAPTFGLYDVGTLLYSTESAINQTTSSWTTAWASGDYVMFAIDIDNGKFYYGVNGSWTGASSNPTAGTGGYTFTPGGYKYTPMTTIYQEELQINFGNGYFGTTVAGSNSDSEGYGKFKYTPPTGYLALCTKNLATYG